CWLDVRLFNTLRLGPVDFCRRNLRYRPGTLECYRFLDQVCMTFVPSSGWVTSRSPVDTQVLACPDGPEPPVCRRLDLPALPCRMRMAGSGSIPETRGEPHEPAAEKAGGEPADPSNLIRVMPAEGSAMTQLESAQQGIVTREMSRVAQREGVVPERI